MLVNADVKGLEVVTAADLSQDKVLMKEIWDKVDIHETNRDRFKLGEGKAGRLIAKIFKFRLIYGGSAYSYAHDPDFFSVGYSEKQWQRVIDEYYEKYKGLKAWHDNLLLTVMKQGYLTIPSGRYFSYKKNEYGRWPLTTIKNYPVQGFGADLVKLARIEFYRRLLESGLPALFISTIHDSLVVDVDGDEEMCYNISVMLKEAIESVPDLARQEWDYNFSLPLTCEIQWGMNKRDMKDIIS